MIPDGSRYIVCSSKTVPRIGVAIYRQLSAPVAGLIFAPPGTYSALQRSFALRRLRCIEFFAGWGGLSLYRGA
jgi:hypothetical protein